MPQEVGELLGALGVGVLRCDVFVHPQWPNCSKQQQHSTPGTVYPPPVAPHTSYKTNWIRYMRSVQKEGFHKHVITPVTTFRCLDAVMALDLTVGSFAYT